MSDQNQAPKRIWLRFTDKTVMERKPSDADEYDVEYIRADRAAPTDSTALVEALEIVKEHSDDGAMRSLAKRTLDKHRAALASREAPPAAQESDQCSVCRGKSFAKIDGEQARWRCVECKTVTPSPLEQVRAKIEGLIEDAIADAEVDYPAGREAGHSITWDSDKLLDDILATITPPPACQQEAFDLAAARAEIERLTKERDAQYEENVNRIAMQAKAEAERDEALVQMAGAFEVAAQTLIDRFAEADADKIRALVPAGAQTALQSMLADAERDMRQRAADLCNCACMDGIGDQIRAIGDEILALPLKYMGQIHAECDCPHPDRCTSHCITERNK